MKKNIYLLFISVVLILSACKTIPPCNDNQAYQAGKQKKYHGKRIKQLVAERNQLCARNFQLKVDTTKQGVNYRLLQSSYNSLKNEYSALGELTTSTINGMQNVISQKISDVKQLEARLAKQDSITRSLNNIVKNALLGFNTDELVVIMKNGKVYVSMTDKLLFKSGSDVVEAKGVDALKRLADVLSQNNNIDVLVEGHTDSIPIKTAKFKDNWDLSTARATNIVRLLITDGVDPLRLTSSGRAEFEPVASNATPEGRAKNRRTDIILSPKLEELFNIIDKR